MRTSPLRVGIVSCAAVTVCALGRGASGQPANHARGGSVMIYIGTYAHADARGIFRLELNEEIGELSMAGGDVAGVNPSFVALSPDQRFLYAANETSDVGPERGGWVSAFSVDRANGALTLLNRQPTRGGGPCHVSVDSSGKVVMAANYGGGSVVAFPVRPDGSLAEPSSFQQHHGTGPDRDRQEGPHAHSIYPDPSDHYALSADLGVDRVIVYRLDPAHATLEPHGEASVAPGSGPRHIAFSKDGRFAYVIGEMGCTITVFSWDAGAGKLSEVQTVPTLPGDFHGRSTCAEIEAHPSGKYLYGSNRGHDSIVAYSVDQKTGRLTTIGWQPSGGKSPRSFAVDPSGRWLVAANQDSGNVVVLRIDPGTGALMPTGHSVQIPMPVCVVFAKGVGPR